MLQNVNMTAGFFSFIWESLVWVAKAIWFIVSGVWKIIVFLCKLPFKILFWCWSVIKFLFSLLADACVYIWDMLLGLGKILVHFIGWLWGGLVQLGTFVWECAQQLGTFAWQHKWLLLGTVAAWLLIWIVCRVVSSSYKRLVYGKKEVEYYPESWDIRRIYYLKNGQKNGPETFYYHSEKINKKQFWKDGKLEGASYIYYPTGEVYIKQVYQNGEVQGRPQVCYILVDVPQTQEITVNSSYLKKQEASFDSTFAKYKQATYREIEKKTFWRKIKKCGKYVTGIDGYQNRKRAKNIEESCGSIYKLAKKITHYRQCLMKEGLQRLGSQRIGLLKDCVGKFLGALRDINQNNKEKTYKLLDKADLDKDLLSQIKSLTLLIKQAKDIDMSAGEMTSNTILVGALGSITAAGTPTFVTSAVGAFATASTGTAISSLSGAAATNATLAWLGGGSLASGGGGVAAGTAMLGGITFVTTGVVALVSAGLIASSYYSNKLTKVEQNAAKIATGVKQMECCWPAIDGIIQRTNELISITNQLSERTMESLRRLLPLVPDFDSKNSYHTQTFQRTALFVKALIEIINTPLLDDKGNISVNGKKLIESSQKMLKNTELVSYE